jgi:hypothetical protein
MSGDRHTKEFLDQRGYGLVPMLAEEYQYSAEAQERDDSINVDAGVTLNESRDT